MYKVVFGDYKPGLPPSLDGQTVEVVEWRPKPRHNALVRTKKGLIYAVGAECLEEIVVKNSKSTKKQKIKAEKSEKRDKIIQDWPVFCTEEPKTLEEMFTKLELRELLEDMYPLPKELMAKTLDKKKKLAEKVSEAFKKL